MNLLSTKVSLLGFGLFCAAGTNAMTYAADYADPQPIPGAEEQYAWIQRDTGYGIISSKGKLLIKPVYCQIDYAGSDRFIARQHNCKGGDDLMYLLDRRGKQLAKLDVHAQGVEPFREGILRIGYAEYLSYLNVHGHTIVKPGVYSYGGLFHEGLANVYLLGARVHTGAYINRNGESSLGPYPHCDCFPFQNGSAIVIDTRTGVGGVINKTGRYVLPAVYEALFSVDGMHFFARRNGKAFLLSNSNQVLANFPDNCLDAKLPEKLSESSLIACRFAVNREESKEAKLLWGYCDVQGKIVIPPRFDGADWIGTGTDFFNVYMDDFDRTPVAGMIDRNGNWIQHPVLLKDESNKNLSEKWKQATPQRQRIFSELLNRYDFIAMKEPEIISILGSGLGAGEQLCYDLTPGATCGYISRQIQFDIKNGSVQQWRLLDISSPMEASWITYNAVLKDPKTGLQNSNLIQKQSSDFNN